MAKKSKSRKPAKKVAKPAKKKPAKARAVAKAKKPGQAAKKPSKSAKPSPAKKPSTPAKAAKQPAATTIATPSIATTCDAIESYFAALREQAIIDLSSATLEPQSTGDIAKIDTELGFTVPAELHEFLARGLKGASGSIDGDDFAAVGFEFNDAAQIIEHTTMLRGIAKDNDDEQSAVIMTGIALTFEEPELVLAADGHVHHWSFRNPKLDVAPSFGEFLAHWAASGCHASHSFTALWPRVKELAPLGIPPKQNLWLKAYKKQFPDFVKL